MAFDLLIRGGEILDPGAGLAGRLDLGVRDGRVAAVERDLPVEAAREIIDASGRLVTPGLIDIHTHVYWGVTYWGIEADPVAARTGVTTWVDAGSAGAYTINGFRAYVTERSAVRVLPMINISSIGLVARTFECATLEYCDVDLCLRMAREHADIIPAVKARIDRYTTRGVGVEPLRRARRVADELGLPLMVHIGGDPPALEEIVAFLRPGDILTHCFTGQPNRILTSDGVLRNGVRRLWDAGLVLDIGHGTGSFSFEVAERMIAVGLPPDVISSDIHQLSVQGPMFDLPTTMSKFLLLGLSLAEVVERTTVRAARAIRRPDLGTLRVGAPADIALLQVEEGEFVFHDVFGTERRGRQRLRATATIVGGRLLEPRPARAPAPWAQGVALTLPAFAAASWLGEAAPLSQAAAARA